MNDDKANECRMANLKYYLLILSISLLLFVISGPQLSLCAQDELSVSRDKDKTVYSIDSNDENRFQQEKERDRAWDTLRNMPVIIDGRQVNPSPVHPVQPAPVK
jgi:hypothetical protein